MTTTYAGIIMRRTVLCRLVGLYAGLYAVAPPALSQPTYCEREDIQNKFLTMYVCQGVMNCADYGIDDYQKLIGLTEQNIRYLVANKHAPVPQTEAGAKYQDMVREISVNAIIASRKVVKSIKSVPSGRGLGFSECAVFLDIDLDAVAVAHLPTAISIAMNESNGFLGQSTALGLEENNIKPFMLALKPAQEVVKASVRSIKHNTWFRITPNGVDPGVHPNDAMIMVFDSPYSDKFRYNWNRYSLYQSLSGEH
jgi:hypothetical protein